jgi:hypothetical protein
MTGKQNLILVSAGLAAFGLSLALLFDPETTGTSAMPPATELGQSAAPAASRPSGFNSADVQAGMESPSAELAARAMDPTITQAAEFDDASYAQPVDELLIIEPGDPTRYITPADRAADLARRQRSREASLNASALVGDERVRALGTLGTYVGEGNRQAMNELRRVLKSSDPELRADGLEAIASLLPGSERVPPISSEPLTDDIIDQLIQALQAKQES